ncbi:MAG: nucleotidyltransferase [SAR324 cluster bacterium]|uniref:Nucleotidyltransferase n=1 Tax=SAR324 cluster bacterium TaxID=2024889 RepID=A0A2A4T4P2_9DELT|nr:MAG: nucleotidyltransferase [SAR324 cluster bacterium]
MKCLIIAAGNGSRLKSLGNSKPLTPLLGRPLIEHVIRTAKEGGVDEFFVVIGYRGDEVKSFLEKLSKEVNLPITTIQNDDWQKENGLSVLLGKDYIQERFLLTMSDHLYNPEIIKTLSRYPYQEGEVLLAVDKSENNPLIDMDDVTRVQLEGDKIRNIGKHMEDYNAFDTGVFLCSPQLFDALEQASRESGDNSLSGGMRILSDQNKAIGVDVTGNYWIDVDSPTMFKLAEENLADELCCN